MNALCAYLLPDQVSNLNSSDPESDVLPITPSGNEAAKLNIYQKKKSPKLKFFGFCFTGSFLPKYLAAKPCG